MRILKTNPVLTIFNSYLVDSPQPSTISYLWNFGSLLGLCLVSQIVSGILLAMHYQGSASFAFLSVEHIMRDVNDGWLIRMVHANIASFFFICVYLHISRGLYYGSYRSPRIGVWVIGTIIFFLMMATAFLGYVLPYGQMSLWGATVITNLLSAIPWLGKSLVEFVWGGFSVSSATINRFFSLHFTLPFILAALVVGHLLYLHVSGSSNPVGTTSNTDRTAFHPYFSFKDLVTVYLFFIIFTTIVFYAPDKLGHSDNYIEANSMQTPASIVPEWYLLPFYAILRSIPNKLLGVISMFVAILILLVLPFTDTSNIKGSSFNPMYIIAFWIFVLNFLVLMWLGSCHVEAPFIVAGQIATAYYFSHFLIILPLFGIINNVLSSVGTYWNASQKRNENKIKFFSKDLRFSFALLSPSVNIEKDILENSPSSDTAYSIVILDPNEYIIDEGCGYPMPEDLIIDIFSTPIETVLPPLIEAPIKPILPDIFATPIKPEVMVLLFCCTGCLWFIKKNKNKKNNDSNSIEAGISTINGPEILSGSSSSTQGIRRSSSPVTETEGEVRPSSPVTETETEVRPSSPVNREETEIRPNSPENTPAEDPNARYRPPRLIMGGDIRTPGWIETLDGRRRFYHRNIEYYQGSRRFRIFLDPRVPWANQPGVFDNGGEIGRWADIPRDGYGSHQQWHNVRRVHRLGHNTWRWLIDNSNGGEYHEFYGTRPTGNQGGGN